MAKILFLAAAFMVAFSVLPSKAMNFGLYKPQEEYGIFDGFKFNFFDKREGQKLIELRSETPEEQERLKREKEKPPEQIDEHQMYKFMQDGTIPF